jgi:hypothetical protein
MKAAEKFIEEFEVRIHGLLFTPEQALRIIRAAMIQQRLPSSKETNG